MWPESWIPADMWQACSCDQITAHLIAAVITEAELICLRAAGGRS